MIVHKTIDVPVKYRAAGCFLIVGDDVLLIQRQQGKPFPLHWAIPTGKIEPGETPADCMSRELHEELSLHVPVDALRQVSHFVVDDDGTVFEYVAFAAILDRRPNVSLKPDEVHASQWAPLDGIRKRRVVPYFYNTVADLLEWRSTGEIVPKHEPCAELTSAKVSLPA